MAAAAPSNTGAQLRGRLAHDATMARYTSWRTGGRAELLYVAADLDDACNFLAAGNYPLPLTLLGLGSNLLVRDGGVRGTILRLAPGAGAIAEIASGMIRAEAGAACPKLAKFAVTAGLMGGEFLAGIPGSVGGALAMNAGCYGSETWQRVAAVETIGSQGQIERLEPKDFAVGYRSVKRRVGQPLLFAAAEFAFGPDDGSAAGRMRDLLASRAESQPVGTANAGSVFTNPPGASAGRLLDEAGMRGTRIGDAVVSGKHANFIVNAGQASAADIEQLIERMQKAVMDSSGIEIKQEVRIIGEAA